MTRMNVGRGLILLAALSTILVPVGVDGFLFAQAHMDNPNWLPHAKLHCAMSFFGAIGLGLGAVYTLATKPGEDRSAMRLAAFLATIFWVGLIASGFWPGAAYDFVGDPANYQPAPVLLGIPVHLNVVAALASIALGWAGYLIATPAAGEARTIERIA